MPNKIEQKVWKWIETVGNVLGLEEHPNSREFNWLSYEGLTGESDFEEEDYTSPYFRK